MQLFIADYDVCFCRLMNQLAGVNIPSSLGRFTNSYHCLTYFPQVVFVTLPHYYIRQVNEVNGGDNVFVQCVCVCVCVSVCLSVCAQRPVMGVKC